VIRIARGAPPRGFRAIGTAELRRVRDQLRRGEPIDLGDRYNAPEIRAALCQAQEWKCCYCEIVLHAKGNPIEHFRPKSRARRGAMFPDHGYWWLAWSWENLLFACPACNGTKGDRFPLDPSGRVLPRGRRPPGPERPLLVDPASEQPMNEIRFVRLDGRWRPVPRALSPRGGATIRCIGLDAPDLLDAYGHHVELRVTPLLKAVKSKMAAGDRTGVSAAWRELRRVLFGPKAPYKALSYDVIDQTLSASDRAAFGLRLPRL
jgi:uncharacterized protein (TIGR02646 family)